MTKSVKLIKIINVRYLQRRKQMTKAEKLLLMKNRLNTLEKSVKNIKCGGAVRALRREVRNLESEISKN